MKINLEQPIVQLEDERVIPVHEERIGLMKYKFVVAEEELKKWNKDVDQIKFALESNDIEKLTSLFKNEKLIERGEVLLERVQFFKPEEQDYIKDLLAISLWVIDNQNYWPGNLKSGFRLIKGGLFNIEEFTKQGGALEPSCLDMAAITQALTKSRGISGEIKRLGTKGLGSRFEHRYWQSDKGFIVDTLWGIQTGGLYLTDKEFETRKKERQQERKLGSFIGSYNSGINDDCLENYSDAPTKSEDQKAA